MLYPGAYRDMEGIYAYIAREKLSPLNARAQTDRIWDVIFSLEHFPESHQERTIGRYAGKGYRQMIVNNYLMIFRIDAARSTVYVVTVQYQARDI